MSAIGMREEVCSNAKFALVITVGSAFAEIFDDDDEHVLNVPLDEVDAVQKAFGTITAMYLRGFKDGSFNGRQVAKLEIRKALDL